MIGSSLFKLLSKYSNTESFMRYVHCFSLSYLHLIKIWRYKLKNDEGSFKTMHTSLAMCEWDCISLVKLSR